MIDCTLYPLLRPGKKVVATRAVKKGLSDRQRRRLRATIAKRLVECDIESLRKSTAQSLSSIHTIAAAQTVTGCGSATAYESGQDDLHVLSFDDQPSIEDGRLISHDYDDCEPVASGCTSELSESSDDSEHLNTPDDQMTVNCH